jgi:hypothetical protein
MHHRSVSNMFMRHMAFAVLHRGRLAWALGLACLNIRISSPVQWHNAAFSAASLE